MYAQMLMFHHTGLLVVSLHVYIHTNIYFLAPLQADLPIPICFTICPCVYPSIHIKNLEFMPVHSMLVQYHKAHSDCPPSISDGGSISITIIMDLPPLPFEKVDSEESLSVLSLHLIFWAL